MRHSSAHCQVNTTGSPRRVRLRSGFASGDATARRKTFNADDFSMEHAPSTGQKRFRLMQHNNGASDQGPKTPHAGWRKRPGQLVSEATSALEQNCEREATARRRESEGKPPSLRDTSPEKNQGKRNARGPIAQACEGSSGAVCTDAKYEGSVSTFRRFQRIDSTKVVFLNNKSKNNSPFPGHLAVRQNREMMVMKGNNFNKLKQKNKREFYDDEVDTSTRAFQFEDSD
uniref:Srp40 C-terminal domain-containing protein n=1 Tax=Trypanosoma vivax (strain Y486) TaxID=1055687 RepID=G0U0W8_TRYVY|nr:conserved hypothetical protein [Trypanosoma vivax Y486]